MTPEETEAIAEAAAKRAAEQVARKAAEHAVRDFCLRIGLPIETADDVRRAQADFAYLRSERETRQRMAGWILKAIVLGVLSGAMAATWQGVKSLITGGQ